MSAISNLKRYKEIIVLPDYTFSGGGARPIYTYYRHKLNNGDTDVLLLRLDMRRSTLKLLILLFFKNRIIVNGIASFYRWPVYLACFVKKATVVYLHEGASHVDAFRRAHPMRHRMFTWVLKHRKTAFVSSWQERYFRDHYTIGRGAVVHNAMSLPLEVPRQRTNIAMIAYQTRRKNVDFFSEVADLAARQGKEYAFHWIGGEGGEMQTMYHSPNVTWWGDQDQVMDVLNNIDVLLFTSVEDIFGLVIMEAIVKGKRVVSYKENGLAEHVRKLGGCRVFDEFDADAVLKTIEAALAEPIDLAANKRLATELCGVENLQKRLDALFAS